MSENRKIPPKNSTKSSVTLRTNPQISFVNRLSKHTGRYWMCMQSWIFSVWNNGSFPLAAFDEAWWVLNLRLRSIERLLVMSALIQRKYVKPHILTSNPDVYFASLGPFVLYCGVDSWYKTPTMGLSYLSPLNLFYTTELTNPVVLFIIQSPLSFAASVITWQWRAMQKICLPLCSIGQIANCQQKPVWDWPVRFKFTKWWWGLLI